jgi:hypothetical protein
MGTLRTSIPVQEAAERHAAGESLNSLARAYGTTAPTVAKHLRLAGHEVRARHEAVMLANTTREWGPSKAQGQVTANRKLRRRKRDIVQKWKTDRGCARCGEKHPAVLDLHHRDPSTKHHTLRKQQQRDGYRKGGSGRGWVYMSFRDLVAELTKCTVLCSNCHRIIEWEQRQAEGVTG